MDQKLKVSCFITVLHPTIAMQLWAFEPKSLYEATDKHCQDQLKHKQDLENKVKKKLQGEKDKVV